MLYKWAQEHFNLGAKRIKITTPIRVSVFADLFHSTIEFFDDINFFHIFVISLQSNYNRNRSKLFHWTIVLLTYNTLFFFRSEYSKLIEQP